MPESLTGLARSRFRRCLVALASGLALVLLLPIAAGPLGAVAVAEPEDVSERTADELAQVRARLAELEATAAAAFEEHKKAAIDLAAVRADLEVLRADAAQQRRAVAAARRDVGNLARAAYAGGGIDAGLQLLLSDSADDFFFGQNILRRVGDANAATLDDTRARLDRLAAAEDRLARAEQRAADLADARAAALKRARTALAEARRMYAELRAELKVQLRLLRTQERAAAAAVAAAARADLAEQLADPTFSADVGDVLDYALAQVGKRYVLGAEGPAAFDCSGLVLAAYRQVGIALPRYSDYQYAAGRPVALARARPGDIVFFSGLGAHHVGLYLGDGRMVHAANPGVGVTVSDVLGPWYGERLTGLARILQ